MPSVESRLCPRSQRSDSACETFARLSWIMGEFAKDEPIDKARLRVQNSRRAAATVRETPGTTPIW